MAGSGAQDEIRAVFDQLVEAQNAGDAQRTRALMSQRPGAVHIGTDAEEWWTATQLADEVAAASGSDDVQVVADDLDVHVQGDVAWAEGRGRFTRAGGGERPVRLTGVFLREDGQWKLVQSHSSIGVPNAEIFGYR
jgi:ketosteroid isomerase-like protein